MTCHRYHCWYTQRHINRETQHISLIHSPPTVAVSYSMCENKQGGYMSEQQPPTPNTHTHTYIGSNQKTCVREQTHTHTFTSCNGQAVACRHRNRHSTAAIHSPKYMHMQVCAHTHQLQDAHTHTHLASLNSLLDAIVSIGKLWEPSS